MLTYHVMRNEDIRQEVREKIRERRLRWYGHVKRKEEDEFVRWSAARRETGTRNGGQGGRAREGQG